jgi:diaminopimelate decarboxylase
VQRKVPINIDSISELRRLAQIDPDHPISFRVNPDVGAGHHAHVVTGAKTTKFGVPKGAMINAYAEALSLGFEPFGLHCHIGAGVQDVGPFLQVTDVMIDLVNEIKDVLGLKLEVLDIGGGIGIPYRPGDHEMDLENMAEAIIGRIKGHTSIKTIGVMDMSCVNHRASRRSKSVYPNNCFRSCYYFLPKYFLVYRDAHKMVTK